MDALLRDREEIDRLRRRIGTGVAMEVRRVRPSERGTRVAIADRRLVDMVCLEDMHLADVLQVSGWVPAGQRASGKHIKALQAVLGAALDRMTGPVRGRSILTL